MKLYDRICFSGLRMNGNFFKSFLRIGLMAVLLVFWASCKEVLKPGNPPNILLILTDDQAYGDLSMNGNPWVETPVIDNLAQEGAYASHFYVSPVCAPTRASLLTGRYHQKTGVSGVTRGREDMSLEEETMGDVFKTAGYTTGIFGKWHNGAHYPYHPLGRGFDEFAGFTSGHWSSYFNTTIEKNGKPFETKGYLPDVLTDEAIRFMRDAANNGQPFLCYVPFQTPHTPLQVPDKYFDKYKAKGLDDFNACIYGMCENIDDNVNRLLVALDEMKMTENTIVVYFSDNGPLNYRYNLGLKGRKGQVNEGGVRVPFIMKWPQQVKGGIVIDESLAHIDILPTLADLAGIDHEFKNRLDGRSFKSLLDGQGALPDRFLFNEFFGKERVLYDPYLMVGENLYDVREDPLQKKNLKEDAPLVYDSLKTVFDSWMADVKPEESGKKYIPLGYDAYPVTTLPAHEAHLFPPFEARKDRRHTGIAYHSLYGWAHDWIDYWTSTDAYAEWYIDVVNSGRYKIEMDYALLPENIGTVLHLSIGDKHLSVEVDEAFMHSPRENHDRVEREQEAPETDWGTLSPGEISLPEGRTRVKIQAQFIPGSKTIELKGLRIIKQ
ncbi:arylsulfatase [Marinilabilia rubra]|uniref:Sulfatase N-terminal domain-containing protein n=1 Tax=Marinilabilia rubra TaxID=2162893 RepID=A0A2U2B8K0_9BACT|nr:arylsulfatase [Marinilabilia rubra]PWD99387.1 hypothetical protein DDZ16_10280 [Marinilabilia rubra]